MFKDRLSAFQSRADRDIKTFDADSGALANLLRTLATKGDSPLPAVPEEHYHEVISALRTNQQMQLPVRKLGRVSATFMRSLLNETDAAQIVYQLMRSSDQHNSASLYKNILIGCLSCIDMNSTESEHLVNFSQNALPKIGARWQQRVSKYHLLEKPYGSSLTKKLIDEPDENNRGFIIADSGINNFQSVGIGLCVYRNLCEALAQVAYTATNSEQIHQVLDTWKTHALVQNPSSGSTDFRVSGGDLAYGVESLIAPWLERQPDPTVQYAIQNLLMDTLDDPRTRQSNWSGIDPNCIVRMKQWLALESFEVFIRVISKVALVNQWEARRTFWGWYLDENHVHEIWPVVGTNAALALERMNRESTDGQKLKYGRLTGASSDQCVLLMRIGELTVAEWSHNGSVRFWLADNPRAPSLYLQNYTGPDLRANSNWERAHQGGWHREVDSYVANTTGIRQFTPGYHER